MNPPPILDEGPGVYLFILDGTIVGPLTRAQMEKYALESPGGIMAVRLENDIWFSLPGGGADWVLRAKYLFSHLKLEDLNSPSPEHARQGYSEGRDWGAELLAAIGWLTSGLGGYLRMRWSSLRRNPCVPLKVNAKHLDILKGRIWPGK